MKVIIANEEVYPFHSYGGVQKRVYYLSKHLLELGVDVEVAASLPITREKTSRFDGVLYNFIPPKNVWDCSYDPIHCSRLMVFSLNLARFLGRKKFDVLHTFLAMPYFYLHLKKRVPVVFEPFEEIYEYKVRHLQPENVFQSSWFNLVRFVKWIIDKYCIEHAELITSEGEFQTKILCDMFGASREKILFLPNMVDILTVDQVLESSNTTRRDLGLTSEDFVLLSVNRLEPNKGVTFLIDAFRIVKQMIKEAKLIIVGSGSEESKIREKILDSELINHVIHFKRLPEELLFSYASMADVYVSPTLDTGSIQAMIECMACALPVVSTTEGPRWVRHGVNGYLTPKRNPQSMAEAILRLHESGRLREFGKKSREIAERFDYKIFAKILVKKYSELVAN